MAELTAGELHLIKKALCVALLVSERQTDPFESASDQADMKALLDKLVATDREMAHYTTAARLVLDGGLD